jgi:hypothetical protein
MLDGHDRGSPTQEPLGIAILVNGYFDTQRGKVLPDAYGFSMLEQIAAAV